MLDLLIAVHGILLIAVGVFKGLFKCMLGGTKAVNPVTDTAFGYFLGNSSVRQKRLIGSAIANGALNSLRKQCVIHKDLRGIWFKPKGSASDAHPDVVLVFAHEGAMVAGGAASGGPVWASIVNDLHQQGTICHILSVEYSLAPEKPFPHALSEVLDTISTELKRFYSGSDKTPPAFVLCGCSAGGNLVLASLIVLHQYLSSLLPGGAKPKTPIFAGLLLISPWLDLSAKQYAIPNPYGDNDVTDRHVYPCSEKTVPASKCACTQQHNVRMKCDICHPSLLTTGAGMYLRNSLAQVVAASPEGPLPDKPANSVEEIYNALLQHVKASGVGSSMGAMLQNPLVSPAHVNPGTVAAVLQDLVYQPALVLAGELEVMLPDIQLFVDKVRAANTGSGSMIDLELWPNEVHAAVLLPAREASVPRLTQYVAGVTDKWKAAKAK